MTGHDPPGPPTHLVALKDRDGLYRMANEAFCAFVGRPVEQVLGADDARLFPEAQARRNRDGDRALPRSGETRVTIEDVEGAHGPHMLQVTRARLCGGPERLDGFLFAAKGLRDGLRPALREITDRRTRAAVAADLDLTTRHDIEQELRRGEERLRLALEGADLGTWDWNLTTDRMDWDERCQAIFGVSPRSGVSYATFIEQVHPDDRERVDAAIHDTLEQTGEYDVEYRILRPDGTLRWIAARGRVIWDEAGDRRRALRFLGVVTDITSRRREQDDLRRSRTLLAESQAVSRIGGFEWEVDSNRAVWTDELHRVLGIDLDAASARDEGFLLNVHPDDRADLGRLFEACFERGEAIRHRFRVLRQDDTERTLEIQAHVIPDPSGQPLRVVGTVQDVTDQARTERERLDLEARLQRARRLESLGILAGGVAHDFNNILTGLIGNLDLTLQHLPPDSPVRHFAENALRASLRAADLSSQMLAYSGGGRFVIEPLDLSELVRQTIPHLRGGGRPMAEVEMDLAEDLPRVNADAGQLRQVLLNLMINAAEAIGEAPGTITVRTGQMHADPEYLAHCVEPTEAAEGPRVFLEVADTGCGMTHEAAARAFDPFYSTRFTGRGLGLAVVLGVARGHKAAIHLDTEPGRGTRFRFLLPPATPEAAHEHRPPLPTPYTAVAGGAILVVDDDTLVREATCSVLEMQGFRVLGAPGGAEALQMLKAHPEVQVVVLDLTMPGMGGEEALPLIREIRPDVPVLLTSGYTEQEATARFAGADLAGFVAKPIDFAALGDRLRALIRPG